MSPISLSRSVTRAAKAGDMRTLLLIRARLYHAVYGPVPGPPTQPRQDFKLHQCLSKGTVWPRVMLSKRVSQGESAMAVSRTSSFPGAGYKIPVARWGRIRHCTRNRTPHKTASAFPSP